MRGADLDCIHIKVRICVGGDSGLGRSDCRRFADTLTMVTMTSYVQKATVRVVRLWL